MAPPQWTGPSLRNRLLSVMLPTDEVEPLRCMAFWIGEAGGESITASMAVVGESFGETGGLGKVSEWTGARERKPSGLRIMWVFGAEKAKTEGTSDIAVMV